MSTLQDNITDLTIQAPRSPRERLGGYVILARALDKGRATLAGKNGEYHFNCPIDQKLFGFKGVTGEQVLNLLRNGATDEEVVEWLNANGNSLTEAEIGAFGTGQESFSPYSDPEKRDWFAGMCKNVGLDPETATLFDMLDADDKASF